MAKPNYGYKKYLREQKDKKKRDEKRRRKLAKKNGELETDTQQSVDGENPQVEEQNKEEEQ